LLNNANLNFFPISFIFTIALDRSRVERNLGLVVCRGTQVSLVHPEDGAEEIANPFLPADDEEEDDS